MAADRKSLDYERVEAFLTSARALLAVLDAHDAVLPAIHLGQAIDEIDDWARTRRSAMPRAH
jgi:sensor histidine kinase regulating citrate/malate metabolism